MMAFAGMLGKSLAHAGAARWPRRRIVGAAKLDYPQRIKRVIFLFMNGGSPTSIASIPSPCSIKYDGQPLPGGTIKTERRTGELMKSPFKFKKYGHAAWTSANYGPISAK